MDVKLKVLVGKNAGAELRLPMGKFFIGRADDCQLRPKSDLISRHHCVIMTEDDFVAVRDLGSRNGTFVNDARVAGECELRATDRLRVGPLEFEVVLTQAAKKRPKVTSIKEAAARTVAGGESGEIDDVGAWLGDDAPTPQPDDVTRYQEHVPLVEPESMETEEISAGNTTVVNPRQPAQPPATPPAAPVATSSQPPAPQPPVPQQPAPPQAAAPSPPPAAAPPAAAPQAAAPQAAAPQAAAPPAAPAAPPAAPEPVITEFDLPDVDGEEVSAPKFIPRMAELKPAQADYDPGEASSSGDDESASGRADKKDRADKKKAKHSPMKLPRMPKASTDDSKSAAEDTLRKLFRRR